MKKILLILGLLLLQIVSCNAYSIRSYTFNGANGFNTTMNIDSTYVECNLVYPAIYINNFATYHSINDSMLESHSYPYFDWSYPMTYTSDILPYCGQNYTCYHFYNYSLDSDITNTTWVETFNATILINCSTTTTTSTTTTEESTTTTTTTISTTTTTSEDTTTTTSATTSTTSGGTTTTSSGGTSSTAVVSTIAYGYSIPNGNYGTLPGLNGSGGSSTGNGSLFNSTCTGNCVLGLNLDDTKVFIVLFIALLVLCSIKPFKLGAVSSAICVTFFAIALPSPWISLTTGVVLIYDFIAVFVWFMEAEK